MVTQFSRTELLLGEEGVNKLHNKKVAVFGVGGVGGYVCEALVRSGVGRFTIVDNDTVSLTNINRQIIATHSTVGRYKVDVMKERMLDIYPDAIIDERRCFYLPENADEFDFTEYSYVVDCVDTVTAKIELIMRAKACKVPVISAMGAGNKLNPAMFRVADIYDTNVCPLARVMRRELKKRGVDHLKVVYSEEKPIIVSEAALSKCMTDEQLNTTKKSIPGSIAFAPSAAGLVMAGAIIEDLLNGY